MRQIFNLIILTLGLVSFSSCNAQKKVEGASTGSSSSSSSSTSVSYRVTANNVTTADFNAYIQTIITLSYTDPDAHLATSCSVSSLSRVTATKACSCNSSGVCTVGVTNLNGNTGAGSFKFSVISGGSTSSTASATFTVLPGNAPVTSDLTPSSFNEDTQSLITLPYTDVELDLATSCAISSLVNVTVTRTCLCAAGICTVGVTGTSNYYGGGSFKFNVTSLGQSSNNSSAILTLNPLNDLPAMTAIAPQITSGNTSLSGISFTIADIDSTVACSQVVGTSSKTTLVPNANIIISGDAPNCLAMITPANNQSGLVTITLTLSDSGTPLPAAKAIVTFNLTVTSIPPSISYISNQTTNEDSSLNVNFIIDDVDSVVTMDCTANNLSLYSSSNGLLIPGIVGSDVIFSGTYPNCRATFNPALNKNGSSNIIIRVTDDSSIITDSNIFNVAVTPINDIPVISPILAQSTTEDTASSVITFTISDIDSVVTCSNVIGTSSNTTIFPNANIVIAGTAPNCTAVITPATGQNGASDITLTLTDLGSPMPAMTATSIFTMTVNAINDTPLISPILAQSTNEDTATSAIAFTISDDSNITCSSNVVGTSSNTTIVPNANIVIAGTVPNCTAVITPATNQNGASNITLTLTDLGSPMPAMTATSIFTMTVNAINDTPLISPILAQSTNEDTATSAIAFTISDDSNITCSSNVVGTSSNTTVVPNANIVIAGTAPNCTAVITPVANQNGDVNITLTLTDLGSPMPALTATSLFALTITAINDTPFISPILAQSTNEDNATSAIAFTITDDSNVACSDVVATSSNITIVPNANIVIAGAAPNCTAVITPVANQNGVVSVTLTLTDFGSPMPALTTTSVFALTVNAINDTPSISSILAQVIDEDFATSEITFTISDLDSNIACSNVVGTSSDITVVPNANIVVAGIAPNCTAVITPAANKNGSVSITLTLSDLGTPMPAATATANFSLSIVPVPDLAGTLGMTGVASSYSGNTYSRSMVFTALTIDEAVSHVDVCLSRDTNANNAIDGLELCNVQNWIDIVSILSPTGTSVAGTSVTSSWQKYKIKNGVDSASFAALENPLMNSCTVTNTYFLSIKVENTNRISNIISTPGWTFWEPTCLTSTVLAQWLDASETATMTVVSAKVTNWTDKSGNVRTVSQGTALNQPTYSAIGMGTGLPGVTFTNSASTASTTYLGRAGFAYSFASSSYFTVIKGAAAAANSSRYLFSEGDASISTTNYYAPLMSNSTTNTYKLTGKLTSAMTTPLLSPKLFDGAVNFVMAEDSGTTYYTYGNGVAQTVATTAYTRTAGTFNYYCLGSRWRTGAVTASGFTGTIGEFIIINGILSTVNRNKLEGYSAHKWETNASLPVGHTYLNTPP